MLKPSAATAPALSAADWSRVLALLDTALDLAPRDRAAWLQSSAVPPTLRAKLGELLQRQAAPESDTFLAALPPLPGGADDEAPDEAPHAAGSDIGPYRLLLRIGEGGMGTVWLARRRDGSVDRDVALKTPRRGRRGKLLARRLAQEGRILSALEHPNIARLYDAGVDDDGTPYLALEYVHGQTLLDWCDHHRLGIADRLRLFAQVLAALQYAHSSLVLHRDLKPSNVLVDRHGDVKLLDFGIAKLLSEDADGGEVDPRRRPRPPTATVLTDLGLRAMTPDYAAPEQLSGGKVGTTADIYGLGIVLFELLTGLHPNTGRRQFTDGHGDALNPAAEPRTSAVVTGGRRSAELAAVRSSTPERLKRSLHGDLDLIVAKALKPQPAERYATAAAFADDIARHLACQPILARPGGAWYRFEKLVLRNRLASSTSALAIAAFVVGASVTFWQWRVASGEAHRAQLAYDFMAGLFDQADPQHAEGRQLSAIDLLNGGAAKLETQFAHEPAALAELHRRISKVYTELEDSGAAVAHARRSVALYEQMGGRPAGDYLEALLQELNALRLYGQIDTDPSVIVETYRAATVGLALAERLYGRHDARKGKLLSWLGWAAQHRGHPEEAERLMLQAQEELRIASAGRHGSWFPVTDDLAIFYLDRGRLAKSRDLHVEELRAALVEPGIDVNMVAVELYNLGYAETRLSEFGLADQVFASAVPALQRFLGPAAYVPLLSELSWAQALSYEGRYAQALAVSAANVQHLRNSTLGAGDRLRYAARRSELLQLAGHDDEALALAAATVAHFDGPDHPVSATEVLSRLFLGQILLKRGRIAEALAMFERVVAERRTLASGAPMDILLTSLALAQRAAKQPEAAVETLRQACAISDATVGPQRLLSLRCRSLLRLVQAEQHPWDVAAQQRYTDARLAVVATLPPGHPLAAELDDTQARLWRAAGHDRDAAALHSAAQLTYRAALGRDLPSALTLLH